MKKKFKFLPKGILIFLFTLILTAHTAAGAPYYTRTVDNYGFTFITKDGFIPLTVIEKFGEQELKNPSDITFSADDYMFIADTGNSRVVKVTTEGEFLLEIGAGILVEPKGVFVNVKNELYVADSKQKKVFLFDSDGTLIKEYPRPEDVLFGKTAEYSPSKVCADRAGNIYIISDGNTNGVIQLSREGDFFGYVGANKTPLSLQAIFQRIFFTSSQKSQLKLNVPVSPSNISIDSRGLIYTITQGGAGDGVKKFNIAGVNMLDETYVDELVTDICISPIGNIMTVSSDGYIAEYTNDGEFLFVFGGRDDGYNRDGLFVTASGIAMDSKGMLYVLDLERKNVTVFEPTEYADTVHTALDLHQKGRYLESRQPWENTLRQDALFGRAHRGIGDSFYKLEMYDEAAAAYRLGTDYNGYSESFWEIRNQWMMDNLLFIFVGLILLWVIMRIIRFTDKKTGWLNPVRDVKSKIGQVTLIKQIGFMTYMPKNPADAFYGIKFEKKVSILSSTIIYVLFFVVYIINKYMTGFLYKGVIDGYYEIGTDIGTVFGLFALAVIGNNLVCSISDGEGRLKDVYCGLAYCLMPYLFIKPFVILLSHVLTFNEAFVISFANFFIYAAVILLVIIMVKEIQEYTVSKTFRALFLTVFTMAMLLLTGIIMFALINQVTDFVSSIFREVYFRVG